jgi:hypothetical protein
MVRRRGLRQVGQVWSHSRNSRPCRPAGSGCREANRGLKVPSLLGLPRQRTIKAQFLVNTPQILSSPISIEKNIAENDSVYVLTEIDFSHDGRRSFHRSPTLFFASHSIVSYAGPLQAGWNCCNTESATSSGTCGARFSFNPAAADWADGYKLRGAKSQVCDRQERRSAT